MAVKLLVTVKCDTTYFFWWQISLDGQGITDLNIGWLRSQIGVVSQEPVLFNTTIRANIQYGREGVSHEEIEEACRLSNAHAFISKLPNVRENMTHQLFHIV